MPMGEVHGPAVSAIIMELSMYQLFHQQPVKTYIWSTKDIEKGPWKEISFSPSFHDHTLVFDDGGRVYLIYGNKKLTLVELNTDLSGVKTGGINQVIIENSSAPSGPDSGLEKVHNYLRSMTGIIFLTSPGPKVACGQLSSTGLIS